MREDSVMASLCRMPPPVWGTLAVHVATVVAAACGGLFGARVTSRGGTR